MSYIPHEWKDGELLTTARMNHIENGLVEIRDSIPHFYSSQIMAQTAPAKTILITDAMELPLKKYTIIIEPYQEGSGDPSPTNIRNIIGYTDVTITQIKKNIANTSKATIDGNAATLILTCNPSTTYTISVNDTNELSSIVLNENTISSFPYTFTTGSVDTSITIVFNKTDITLADIEALQIQIEPGSTATEYEVYNATTYTISFNDVLYGGIINVNEAGKATLTKTYVNISSYNGEQLPSTWISNMDVSGTPTTGAQVVYKLANTTARKITGQQIIASQGVNIFEVNHGNISIEYYNSEEALTNDYAAKEHIHTTSDITSGIFDPARIPIATTSAVGGVIVGNGLSITSNVLSVPEMIGATTSDGAAGLVPVPTSNDAASFLRGDGTWVSLSTAMNFIGIATTTITDGSTTDPGISGYTTKRAGDVIIDSTSDYEYVWTGTAWESLGPDSSYALSAHTHGNIQSGGTLQTNDVTVASGDKLVVTENSTGKIARSSISFDGSTTTKALTQKGTWETFIQEIPAATDQVLGGVKIGSTLTVVDGVLDAVNGGGTGNLNIRNGTGNGSILESGATTASGAYSHAEGNGTTASGDYSHAENAASIASGLDSHAEGGATIASGTCAHTEGHYTIGNHYCQHVFGSYNVGDTSSAANTERGTYIEIVGNGTSSSSRANARTLDWSGNEVLSGTCSATQFYETAGSAAPSDTITGSVGTLTSADWSSSSQTITVQGVTASNIVIVSPVPASLTPYTEAQIACTAQGTNSLTFGCTTTPSTDINVNIVMIGTT